MLKDKELINISGGGKSWAIYALIGAAISLIAGVIDGYFRPMKCNG